MGRNASSDAKGIVLSERPMQGTVDEAILKKLYAQMLQTTNALDGARGKEALLGSVVDLTSGDAVSSAPDHRVIRSALERTEGVHTLPPHLGLAAGVAFAYRNYRQGNVVVAVVAPPILDAGSSHEALTYAATEKLPLIVVLDCAGSGEPDVIELRAAAYRIPAMMVDGADPVAVYRVAREAIHRARGGRGPTLIQCLTLEPSADPIARIEHYLEKHGWWTPESRHTLLTDLGLKR